MLSDLLDRAAETGHSFCDGDWVRQAFQRGAVGAGRSDSERHLIGRVRRNHVAGAVLHRDCDWKGLLSDQPGLRGDRNRQPVSRRRRVPRRGLQQRWRPDLVRGQCRCYRVRRSRPIRLHHGERLRRGRVRRSDPSERRRRVGHGHVRDRRREVLALISGLSILRLGVPRGSPHTVDSAVKATSLTGTSWRTSWGSECGWRIA